MIDKEFNMLATMHALEDGVGRRTFMKLLGAAGISLAMTPAVSRMAEAAEIIRGKIANQVSTPANDYWSVWTRAFATASDALGLEKQELFHQNDTARQLSQVRSLPASSARMLIGCVEPAGSLPAVAKFCEENQIFYVPSWESPAWFTPPDIGDHYVSFVTPNSVEGAYEVAKALFDSVGGEGKIVHIAGMATPTDSYRTAGLMQAAKEYPGISIVGGLRANWDREQARKVMLSMITAHPDMKGVFAQNDNMALGVLSVLRERKLDKVKVSGVDGLPEGLREVARGGQMVATHTSLPPYGAGFTAVLAFDALNGWKPTLGERLLFTGSALATADNAANIEAAIYGEGASPFDWALMSRTLNPDNWDPQNKITAIDPEAYWAPFPEGKERLNAAYAGAKDKEIFASVDALYAAHYKAGPVKA
ncbi:sugar ABC transporter substrate-binding protein [Aquamicrobium sp. NLF2-7]|uniref:sugar ABC transporter substrate-binding protein n=1 Tax=Aquamicrobium sp. NLF2-7 TaxID=2918753 RepID=UPI001EFC1E74|nr:sugar ABC transporter substrate-binding protein [Aquamicrobium sp. NLF2-7]MCG8273299.1 sugar ABC transporter substrate-binding protein [Aquamicrobium sp. NLF2-7]